MKTLNALIYPHTPGVIAGRRMIDVATIPPHKAAWWRPVAVIGDDPFDPATHKKTGPVTTIEQDRVVDTYAIEALTPEELDRSKEVKLKSFDLLSFDVSFDQENRIRALEGKSAISRAQYRAALKARL